MKKWMSVFMAFLSIKEFEKKDGKPALTEEQRKDLSATFGEDVTTKFETYLSKDSNEESDDEGIVAQMIQGITAQQKSQANAFQAKLDQVIKENGGLQATIAKLASAEEVDPIPEMDKTLPRKADVASVMRVDMRKGHYAKVGEFLKTGVNSAVYNSTTIDVEDLRTEFGTYLNNQRNLDIVRQIMVEFTTAKYMTTVLAVTEWRAVQGLITSVVQQFSPIWTPLGKVKFKPLTIKNRRHKINVPIIPAEVLDSYLFYLYDESLAPDQMPITKYITEQMIKPQILTDIELRMIAKGKFVDHSWGDAVENATGTPPEDSMDGFETILVENKALVGGATATGMNYFDQTINWKTATDDQVVSFINAFVDWINPFYQSQNMPVFCSADVYKRYKRAYKNKWGAYDGGNGGFGSDQIDYSNNILVPLPSMYRSPILFSTPKQNFIKLRHKNEVPNVINDVQKDNYTVKLFGEFWLGVGFAIGEAVFAYVPDGYNPKAAIEGAFGEYTDYQEYQIEGSSTPAGSGGGGI